MKKKGFTLIELLAVIVILAVIALIVTPIVSNIISNAKIAANARSVEGHVKNIENAIISKVFASSGDMKVYDNKTKIEIEALVAGNDDVTCESYTILNGIVQSANNCTATGWSKTYTFTIANGITIGNGTTIEIPVEVYGTYVAKEEGETHLGIVYLDPSDISIECDEDSIITDTNTGCKKFYIYDDTGDNYTMIMDRNTTATVAWANHDDYIEAGGTEADWNLGKYSTQGPVTVTKQLRIDTANWIGSPRLIRESEVRTITGNNTTDSYYFGSNNNTSYSGQTGTQKAIQRSYHWLFDYTSSCTTYGCKTANSSTSGYWTSDAVSSTTGSVWRVMMNGQLSYVNASSLSYGLRPVIEIPKSKLRK